MMSKFKVHYILIIIVGLLFIYWLKNQYGINFFENNSLSHLIPLKVLQKNRVINRPLPDTLLLDNFDSRLSFNNWLGLWTMQEGNPVQTSGFNEKNQSRCLVIHADNIFFGLSHDKFVEVKKHDSFRYSVKVKIENIGDAAVVCIDAFDQNKNVMKWSYRYRTIKKYHHWVNITEDITITDNISYIRLRLSGYGRGQFKFDDIIFTHYAEENMQ